MRFCRNQKVACLTCAGPLNFGRVALPVNPMDQAVNDQKLMLPSLILL